MAVRRPLFYDASSPDTRLVEIDDTGLSLIRYNLRTAYADVLDSGGKGSVYVGSGGTAIGSILDTRQRAQEAGPHPHSYPGAPGITRNDGSTYNYRQDRTVPSAPTNAECSVNDTSWLYFNGTTTAFSVQLVGDETDIYDTFIADCIEEMRNGDEVGTYRIAAASPGSEWTNKGQIFVDTRFNGSTSVGANQTTTGNVSGSARNLWLKMNATVPTGSSARIPIGWSNRLQELNLGKSSNLIQNVLLPILQRRVSSGDLNYTLDTNNNNINRGSLVETRFSGQTNTTNSPQPASSNNYRSRSTPSGSLSTTVYYFKIS